MQTIKRLIRLFLFNYVYPLIYARKYFGWYDPESSKRPIDPHPAGNTAIMYWNGVIDRYSNVKDYDSVDVYIKALGKMLDALPGKMKVFIHLPLYNGKDFGDGNKHKSLLGWWPVIITAFNDHPKVEGWYMLDEPEAHGYDKDDKPKLGYYEVKSMYDMVKRNSKKPVLCVFVDIDLMYSRFNGKFDFFDIFGFDYYPYTRDYVDQSLDDEQKRIEDKFVRWRNFILGNNLKRTVYVGQAIGSKTVDPNGKSFYHGFGQVEMFKAEFDYIAYMLRRYVPFATGYIMWSWYYSNGPMRNKANQALNNWFNTH